MAGVSWLNRPIVRFFLSDALMCTSSVTEAGVIKNSKCVLGEKYHFEELIAQNCIVIILKQYIWEELMHTFDIVYPFKRNSFYSLSCSEFYISNRKA